MITDKLRKLGEYIEKIDSIKPIEFLESNMKKIEKEFPTLWFYANCTMFLLVFQENR